MIKELNITPKLVKGAGSYKQMYFINTRPDLVVKVFDKAGQVVYTKRGYANDWDGTLNGKKLKEDAYLYIIKFNKDGVLPIRGYLTIVR